MTGKGPGDVLVVCKGKDGSDSLRLLRKSLEQATGKGFYIRRPSQPKYVLSEKKAQKLRRINRALAEDCKYDSIQKAVFEPATTTAS